MYKSINLLGPPTGENRTELSKSVLLLKVKATRGTGGGGGGGAKFHTFLGCLKFLIFFFGGGGGRMVDAGPEPTYEEKMRVPTPPLCSGAAATVHLKNYQEFLESTPKNI